MAVSGTFSATGQSATFKPVNSYFDALLNAASWTSSSVQLERSFDDGTTWYIASVDALGTTAVYTQNFNGVGFEYNPSVVYRWNCTAYGGSAIIYRLS
jgi:hypothetical protein